MSGCWSQQFCQNVPRVKSGMGDCWAGKHSTRGFSRQVSMSARCVGVPVSSQLFPGAQPHSHPPPLSDKALVSKLSSSLVESLLQKTQEDDGRASLQFHLNCSRSSIPPCCLIWFFSFGPMSVIKAKGSGCWSF